MSLVTVLTVTYNSEKTIARAIESVLVQTFSEKFQYIVIDGGSDDRTVEIARCYCEKFKNRNVDYTVISEKDNGMYDALNKGARLAVGEIVGQVNSDDYYEPDALEKITEFYKKENFDLAWTDLQIIKNGKPLMVKKAKIGKIWSTAGFCHPTMFTKRSVLLEFPYAERGTDDDFDMATKVYKSGKKVMTFPVVLSNYAIGGMGSEKSFAKMKDRIRMKYATYRRNGFSRLYWFYSAGVEIAKFILG